MAAKGRRSAISRRSTKASNGVAGRRERAAGVLVTPRILHAKATKLIQINAPNVLSFRKKKAAAQAGRIRGLVLVNSPTSRRSTAGSKPSGHGVNMPKGQW